MIDFFFGKPRSGKSYRAMWLIYNLYLSSKADEPKFKNILTNVGGFNFEKVNQIFLNRGSSSRAYKLVWKEFYIHLKKMYEMATDDKSDDELNKYADYHNINDCLIVLDEASLYMKKYDDVISWWLAYHGHFKIRIIVIAQSPKQINSEYMSHTEIFYEAQPQSKQLRDNHLRYIHYADIPFNKDNKFSSNTIKTEQKIYDLYKSGEVDKPKKIIYKFIAIALVALLAVVFFYNLLINNMKSRHTISDESVEQIDINKSQAFISSSINSIINIRCDKKYCWNANPLFQNNNLTLTYFKYIVLKHDLELEFYEVKNEIFKLIPQRQGGYNKITLAKLTDYYYQIPKKVQKQYLSTLFIPVKKEKKRFQLSGTPNPVTNYNNNNRDSEAVTNARGVP